MRQWRYKVDISDIMGCGDETFEETRDALVARLSGSEWARADDIENGDLSSYLDDLAGTDDPDTFDAVLDEIYDLADEAGAWLDPFGAPK